MLNQKELKLKRSFKAQLDDNYIYSIDDELPPKSEVLQWLDGSNQTTPERKARVLLFMGETQTIEEYIVSPVPNPQIKTKRPNGKLTWKARPICEVVELQILRTFIIDQLETISDIYFDSFSNGCTQISDCFYMNTAPRSVIGSPDRFILVWLFIDPSIISDYYLYSLPFYLLIKTPVKSVNFEIEEIYYNGIKFDSLNHLKKEYSVNQSIRYQVPDWHSQSNSYGSPERIFLEDTIDQHRRPPLQVQPDCSRVEVSGSAVKWLGWSFNIHSHILSGVQLFDVRYNNEKIAYELSMQDTFVLYSGGPPDDYFKNFFDNGYSIGRLTTPLVRGVDCPIDAFYINSNTYQAGSDYATYHTDSICVFEHRNSVPLHRHYSSLFGNFRYGFSMPDSVLIVRQILTVWNYDYIFDYVFHQSGLIELKVSSTGYVAVTNYLDGSTIKHGYIINDHWMATANLHQHIFNFKLDLDIKGTKNNFKTINLKSEEFPANNFSGGNPWPQMVMEEFLVKNEHDAAIRYSFDKPKFYVVYDNTLNQSGYRILSNHFHNTALPDSSPLLMGGASWVKYQLAVTKFKESERTTISEFVQGDPFNPAVKFDDFIADNDTLESEDLVAWVTVGLHHIPTYEDLPVTTTPGKTLSVILAPFNFFEKDPAIHSRDAAVFFHELTNITDSYLHLDNTCTVPNEKPSVY